MSHYVDLKTKIADPKALIRALCRMKNRRGKPWTVNDIEYHTKAEHLFGYQNDQRPEVANVIIRRNKINVSSNDIGFVRSADGTYSAIISDYDRHFHNDKWQHDLYTYYNVEKAKIECEERGLMYTETVDKEGRINLDASFETPEDNLNQLALQ